MNNPINTIQPKKSWTDEWKEISESGELLYYFIWRNFKVRYKQTLIGASWAVIKPLILMIVFTLAFNRIGNIESGDANIPYPIFTYTGLIFWTYFSQTVVQIGNSLVSFQNIIKKIYFPRLIAPVSTALTGIIDFIFSLSIYIVLMIAYQIVPGISGLLLFVPMLLLTFITTLGVGLFMAAMNIKYRDVGQALPFLVQTLLFLTPVVYPVSLVPDGLKWLLFLNPMTGVVDTVQASMLGIREIEWKLLLISMTSALTIFVIGFIYFKAKEKEFADVI